MGYAARATAMGEFLHPLPSEVAQEFRFTTVEGLTDDPIVQLDLTARPYLLPFYDMDFEEAGYKGAVLVSARQGEKSTTLGCVQLVGLVRPGARSLYINSSEKQSRVYSSARIDDTVRNTAVLNRLRVRGSGSKYGVFEKHFRNGAITYVSFAGDTADRVRGISASEIYLDEVQDMIQDVIPVILECAGRVVRGRVTLYAGTHKTFDSTLNSQWEDSTQTELMIPCHRHQMQVPNLDGGQSMIPYFQEITLENIQDGTEGPVCRKCGGALDILDPMRMLVHRNPGARLYGFRLPRPIVPWCRGNFWRDRVLDPIFHDKKYSEASVHNEILALPFDRGIKPLTRQVLESHCIESVSSVDPSASRGPAYVRAESMVKFMGVDWGLGIDDSFTFIVIGGYYFDQGKMNIVHTERLTGDLTDPEKAVSYVYHLAKEFRVHAVGPDYGMGHQANTQLMRMLGAQMVLPVQYLPSVTAAPVSYDTRLHVARVNRTFALDAVINGIKRGVYTFPRASECADFLEDCAALFYEERNGQIIYNRKKGTPDDGIHALAYGTIASAILLRPRPDMFTYVYKDAPTH